MEFGGYASIIVAILNLLAMTGNILSSNRLNSFKGKDATLLYWKEEAERKSSELDDLKEDLKRLEQKKTQYKLQYFTLYKKLQILEGENKTYKKFHGHI